jgi:hypothetical protein
LINNNLGKFFSPSSSYAGYMLIAGGLVALTYSWTSLTLVVPGMFMAFTYTGTLIDIDNKRIKPYTALFGIYRAGQWISTDQFTRFSIRKSTKKYTTYSRGSVRFDMSRSDIELLLTDNTKSKKVVLKRFSNFEDARSSMDELSRLLSISEKHPENSDKVLPDF